MEEDLVQDDLNIEAIPCEDICRLCISKEKSIDISSFPNYEMPRYSEIIVTLTDIYEIDKYAQGICDDCATKLIQYYEFREQIINNQIEIKNIFNNEKDLTLIQVDESIDKFVEESVSLDGDDSKAHELDIKMFANNSTLTGEDNEEVADETQMSEFTDNAEYIKAENEIDDNENENENDDNENDDNENENDDYEIEIENENDELHESKFEPMTEQLSAEDQQKWQKKLDEWIKKQTAKKKKQQIHICDTCGKTYKTSYSLHDHLYVHTGQLNYECTECGRKFGQKKLLQSHMEVKHIKSKFFFCNTCGRRFNRKNNLLKHQWVHRDGGRFPCEHCGKIYKWENSLKAHLNTHSELRPHVCQRCNKSFKEMATLKKHCKSFHDGFGIEKEEASSTAYEFF